MTSRFSMDPRFALSVNSNKPMMDPIVRQKMCRNLLIQCSNGKTLSMSFRSSEWVDEIQYKVYMKLEYMYWVEKVSYWFGQRSSNLFHQILTMCLFVWAHLSFGCTYRQMILSHNGKVLKSECMLSDFIADEKTSQPILLHAYAALNGGCFLVSFSVLLMILGAMAMSFCTCGVSLIFIPLLAPLLFILPLFCL